MIEMIRTYFVTVIVITYYYLIVINFCHSRKYNTLLFVTWIGAIELYIFFGQYTFDSDKYIY